MAYGNWGAFVYRNGERMRSHEDQTPYRETELTPGYHQAFGIEADASGSVKAVGAELSVHHAVLGSGSVRLCGYKCYPVLFLDGERVDLDPHKVGEEPSEWGDYGNPQYDGEVDGHEFRAECRDNFVDLWLKEPDGTTWTAVCGYEYGAGHMD